MLNVIIILVSCRRFRVNRPTTWCSLSLTTARTVQGTVSATLPGFPWPYQSLWSGQQLKPFQGLQKIGRPPNLLSTIKSFHSYIKMNCGVWWQHLTVILHLKSGVKQGYVLAPTLFSAFICRDVYGSSSSVDRQHTQKRRQYNNFLIIL